MGATGQAEERESKRRRTVNSKYSNSADFESQPILKKGTNRDRDAASGGKGKKRKRRSSSKASASSSKARNDKDVAVGTKPEEVLASLAVEDIEEEDVSVVDGKLPAADSSEAVTSVDTSERARQDEVKTNDEDAYKTIKYAMIQNDVEKNDPTTLIRLVGLKTLFAKQLPKMPKEYIARLVFDPRHKSLAILSDDPADAETDDEIVGAICYRPYPEMRFAEIAFCAVSANQQVKGYGTKVMNLVKNQAVREGIQYFITYADNYAIGYFKKQGFSKTVSMAKTRYHGLIKDYDGGTMMECYIHPSVDYTKIPQMLKMQKNFILNSVRQCTLSDKKCYPGLTKPIVVPPELQEHVSRANASVIKALLIPGVLEAGWTYKDIQEAFAADKDGDRQKNHLKSELLQIIRKLEEQHFSWPFREPVNTDEVTDYLEVVKDPIDLSTIEKRIRKGGSENSTYYKSKQMLYDDLIRMVNNCKLYNDRDSTYWECAAALEKFLPTVFQD